MEKVRIGIIGVGVMGEKHARYLLKGDVPNAQLAAVCDADQKRLEWACHSFQGDVAFFDDYDAMLDSGRIDGVIIATSHYSHAPLAIKAMKKGIHVLIEKPAGVYTRQVREMNEAAASSGTVFGIMYNQRTSPLYQKVRELVDSGELGELKRINWIITNWYRTQSYYSSGGWRATWAGEGGGVLLNQAPHQLDLLQWICGMPKRVRAFCSFGKYHNIEVEDDVTAYFEYNNGATGIFITSTGETPGTNRLEILGGRGKIVVEDEKLGYWRLRIPERQFNAEYTGGMGEPECWKCEVPVTGLPARHPGITSSWVDAILKGTPMLSPGVDGINGLQLSNAMLLSTWTDNWVDIPVDEELFYSLLQKRISKTASSPAPHA